MKKLNTKLVKKKKYEDKIKELNETKKSLEEKRQKLIEKNREAQSEKTI